MSDDNNSEFKGAGRVLGTLGGMSLGSLAAWIPAHLLGAKGISDMIKNSEGKTGKTGIGSAVAGGLISLGGTIAGGVYGYKKAGDGISQHKNLTQKLDNSESQTKVLTAEKTALEEKVKWAKKTGKNPDELFTEREDSKDNKSESKER